MSASTIPHPSIALEISLATSKTVGTNPTIHVDIIVVDVIDRILAGRYRGPTPVRVGGLHCNRIRVDPTRPRYSLHPNVTRPTTADGAVTAVVSTELGQVGFASGKRRPHGLPASPTRGQWPTRFPSSRLPLMINSGRRHVANSRNDPARTVLWPHHRNGGQ